MAASETNLGALHEKVASVLLEALDGEEIPGFIDEDPETGEVISVPAKRMAPSAAIIAAATKFLKDNEITCIPDKGNNLGALEQKAADRRAKRAAMTAQDMVDARTQAGYMTQ